MFRGQWATLVRGTLLGSQRRCLQRKHVLRSERSSTSAKRKKTHGLINHHFIIDILFSIKYVQQGKRGRASFPFAPFMIKITFPEADEASAGAAASQGSDRPRHAGAAGGPNDSLYTN